MRYSVLQFSSYRRAAILLALATSLVSFQAPLANACVPRVSLPAIESAMARPDIDPAVLRDAQELKIRAARAIQEGRAADGNQLYHRLMSLLDLQRTSNARC